jgi:hypothetical protein
MGTKHFFRASPRANFGILESLKPGQFAVQTADNR